MSARMQVYQAIYDIVEAIPDFSGRVYQLTAVSRATLPAAGVYIIEDVVDQEFRGNDNEHHLLKIGIDIATHGTEGTYMTVVDNLAQLVQEAVFARFLLGFMVDNLSLISVKFGVTEGTRPVAIAVMEINVEYNVEQNAPGEIQ